MTENLVKIVKKTLISYVLYLGVLPFITFAEEQTLDHQTTAVRYVFTDSVEREIYPWLQEEVANIPHKTDSSTNQRIVAEINDLFISSVLPDPLAAILCISVLSSVRRNALNVLFT